MVGKIQLSGNHDNKKCELENGPVEIVDFSYKEWWFSIAFTCRFTRGYVNDL